MSSWGKANKTSQNNDFATTNRKILNGKIKKKGINQIL
jgi:hypothetical protein